MTRKHVWKGGLHLNNYGTACVAMTLISLIKCLYSLIIHVILFVISKPNETLIHSAVTPLALNLSADNTIMSNSWIPYRLTNDFVAKLIYITGQMFSPSAPSFDDAKVFLLQRNVRLGIRVTTTIQVFIFLFIILCLLLLSHGQKEAKKKTKN